VAGSATLFVFITDLSICLYTDAIAALADATQPKVRRVKTRTAEEVPTAVRSVLLRHSKRLKGKAVEASAEHSDQGNCHLHAACYCIVRSAVNNAW
jgi:hypothetical protein